MQDIEEIKEDPLGDDDIRFYYPNAKIIKYSELNGYGHIDELLPDKNDYAFMLIEESPNKGHWVLLSNNDNQYEVFDSYGNPPDEWLKWNNKSTNEMLGQGEKTLTRLLKTGGKSSVYNPVKYQKDGSDINTCGRHCVFRVKNIKDGKNLNEYFKYMKYLKKSSGKNYDDIVASFVSKT